MFQFLIFQFLILTSTLLIGFSQDLPEPMQPKRLINDFSHLIPDDQEQILENKLRAYNDSTSTQIAIVVLSSTQPYEIANYSYKLAEKWGVGKSSKNNGILILVAKDDHTMFIATGYGMEATITDAMCKRIIEENILPHFKNYQYYEGLNEGVDKIISLASGEYKADNVSSNHDSSGKKVPAFFIFIVIAIFFVIINKFRGGGRHYGGGYGGWGGGSFGSGSFGGGGGSSFGGFGGGSFGGGGAGGSW
ncbi:MAG: hypothetical protein A3K10_05450 [Bacteroidetes bacterium RIFCSPLOWO2_12_FULL_31_6]|nr:MAG: hypothetical protein A3K10_05450 [Bacteroidetes bacterium RIFCSPLOWO2_12_FULL_31_6]